MNPPSEQCAKYVLATFTNIFRGSQPVRSAALYVCNHLLRFKTDTKFPTGFPPMRKLRGRGTLIKRSESKEKDRPLRRLPSGVSFYVGLDLFLTSCEAWISF
jgi:hypothetical protein